jgi:FkbM family methyltransferase
MISYAQNYEDVILWRALKHVKKGCYIDIGAWDPVVDSVSMFFYTQGWRGIHVEPNPSYAKKLREARPDEVVIEAAIGESTKPTTLFIIEDTGLTTSSKTFRDQHKQNGFTSETIKVPTKTLASIFDEVGKKEIHWLKIDAEGMEEEVIKSWGNSKALPWVVAVESTLPSTQIETFYGENELTKRGYAYVYFDKLNKFYVHKLHSELLASFKHGPNIFDDFITAQHKALQEQAETLDRDLKERTKELVGTRAELVERTELLEKNIKDPAIHAKSLVETRAELVVRTELLNKINGNLARRTKELVEAQAELAKRQKLLNKANGEFKRITEELLKAKKETDEQTENLQRANQSIEALVQKNEEKQELYQTLKSSVQKAIRQIEVAEKTINLVAFASNPFLYFMVRKQVKELFQKINLLKKNSKSQES